MVTRNIRKNLAGMQDLFQGVGDENQTRNQQSLTIGRIDVPYSVLTETEMKNLDPTVFTRARVYNGTTEYIEYIYDETITTGVTSNNGPGSWIQIGSGSDHFGKFSLIWDFAVDGGTIGDIVLGQVPDGVTITKGYYEVINTLASAGAATVQVGLDTVDPSGIIGQLAYDNVLFDPGFHETTPDGTLLNFTSKTTQLTDIILTIGTADLTGGAIRFWLEYVRS